MLADGRALRRQPASQPQQGRQALLVRYDIERRGRHSRAKASPSVSPACGSGVNCYRPEGEPVSLGEPKRRSSGSPLSGESRRCGLLVKDEGRLPTGSFKARGLAMAVSMARQFGIERIALPTNGNAGAALAAYGARAGMETIVICPAETPEINVSETAAYGARVWVADGQIDECGAWSARARRRAAGSIARR